VKRTILRLFKKLPELLSNVLAVSLAAQISTTPSIAATSFSEVSIIGVLINLVAVPLSGSILTLGFSGTLAGNVAASLACLIYACNDCLVSVLARSAEDAPAIPYAVVETPGVTLPLVGLLFLGCVSAAVAEAVLPEERWRKVGGLLLL